MMILKTPYVLFLLLITSHVAFAEDQIDTPDNSTLNVYETNKESVEIHGINNTKTIIKRTLTCEIIVKIPAEAPRELFSKILEKRKEKCPLIAPSPSRQRKQPKDIYHKL